MSGISLELAQKALYATLTADASLMALVTWVYDRVPERTAYPYLMFGPGRARDASNATAEAEMLRMELWAFSREGGRKQALDIMERVHLVLHHQYPSLTGGWRVVWLRVENVQIQLLADGITWQAVATLNMLTEPA